MPEPRALTACARRSTVTGGRLAALGLAAAATVATVVPPAPAAGASERGAGSGETARVERRLAVMGTELAVAVEAVDRAAGLAAAERAVRAVEAAEARLSTWRSDSELSGLNRAPVGHPVLLSAELASELAAAAACRRETEGAFDPAIGTLVHAWGLRQGGRVPAPDELAEALAASGFEHVQISLSAGGAGGAVRFHPGVLIEEGGFGKGAGLAAAAAALEADPAVVRATVDLGGQAVLVGPGEWRWGVAHPRHRRRPVLELRLDGGSVATSGNSERALVVDGRRFGHILDPASGRPVPDFGSVTVWTADPLRADCLSTALYAMGPDRALDWASVHEGVEALVVEVPADGGEGSGEELRVRATAGFEGRLEALRPGLEISIDSDRTAASRPVKEQRTVTLPWKSQATARPNRGDVGDGAPIHREYRG